MNGKVNLSSAKWEDDTQYKGHTVISVVHATRKHKTKLNLTG